MESTALRSLPLPCPNPNPRSRLRRRTVRLHASTPAPPTVADLRLRRLAAEFRSLPEPIDRVKRLLRYAAVLPPFPDTDRLPSNRVPGCTAQVWLAAAADPLGRLRFKADSDSEITKGFLSCMVSVLDGALPEEVLAVRTEDFRELNVVGVPGRAASRVNTWHNVLIGMQKRTEALIADGEGRRPPAGLRWDYAEAQGTQGRSQAGALCCQQHDQRICGEGS